MATALQADPKAVEHYLRLPYRIVLIPDDGEWVAALPELPGCLSQGETIEEALAMIREAQRGWLEVSLEHGDRIPEPAPSEHSYTGKFNVRVPKDLHRGLVAAAEEQGVSLNLYVATTLARALGAGRTSAGVDPAIRGTAKAAGGVPTTAPSAAASRPGEECEHGPAGGGRPGAGSRPH